MKLKKRTLISLSKIYINAAVQAFYKFRISRKVNRKSVLLFKDDHTKKYAI